MLQIHKRVAESMGMQPNNIIVADNGSVIEPGEMVRILRMEGVKLYVEKEC